MVTLLPQVSEYRAQLEREGKERKRRGEERKKEKELTCIMKMKVLHKSRKIQKKQERKNAYLKATLMLFTVKGSERRRKNRGRRKEKEEKEKKKKVKEKKEEENGDY